VPFIAKFYPNDATYASWLDRRMNGCGDSDKVTKHCPPDQGRPTTASMRATRCRLGENGGWRIERLGPFRSTGGQVLAATSAACLALPAELLGASHHRRCLVSLGGGRHTLRAYTPLRTTCDLLDSVR